ncbi:MAG: M28 family peptidase [Phenylobacterium sp.]|uniref:M28 family metallopeptidase n=1 Tax=Phenylobacterium sp. TaxID=1871053 RepID=UPI001B65EC86|nr:M28 family metallopeptidase [Phenylobacterium sp.]MBP7649952.1 M28 family peptidase [Phenylobacterium sp.]MBP7817459.1 M28 family peptidase [Phenylobacterium sp.]MBP9231281.1 M28 family peptidase [Phenylobacterium sp.]
MKLPALTLAAVLLATTAHAQTSGPIDPARLSAIVKVLASDEFEGRSPGSPGEQKTVDYLIGQFEALKLEPAGDKGGWTQEVQLQKLQVQPGAKLSVSVGGKSTALQQAQQINVATLRPVDHVAIASAPMVFVGYGVKAPERGWDDFKGADLKGKVAVFLINDPDFEAKPGEPVAGKFGGQAAAYYARWTYKYEEAVRQGAIAALIVHETPGAGYGWSTVAASNGESFDIVRADPARDKLLLQGWIARDTAVDLFRQAGLDFEALKTSARSPDFKPVALTGAAFSADYGVAHSQVASRNVIAKLTGASRPEESVMFSAHWDAFGLGAPVGGDKVRHGAADDAIGVAGVLEIARALAAGPRPARTTLFATWTAEERGLLGSEYYAAHPHTPLDQMAANLTMDVLQTAGPARDVVLVGYGQSQLDDRLIAAAKAQDRTVTPDARPERGLFFRADHFSLAKQGVPVMLLMGLGGGADLVKGGRAAGDKWVSDYTANCYHQPCDAWSPDWDLRGAAQDVELFYVMGKAIASDPKDWPDWKDGSEFKAIRAKTAGARR